MDRIKLLKNNTTHPENFQDIEWVREFYEFLQGNSLPEGISISRGHKPKMSSKKAMSIIWYLQEHFAILPDNIEKCSVCDGLFDTLSSGIYWETKGKHYCGGCDHIVPINYDKGKK
jgi:hypothetical protein